MNIIIVDDDDYMIKGIQKALDWPGLGFEGVYTAHNIRQAKVVLESVPIEVMICDIEMPQGSGLDLLEWVREHQIEIDTIFLTSFADFSYAQRAIQLQSLDYLLKPVDYSLLEEALHRAIRNITSRIKEQEHEQNSLYWLNNRKHIVEHFWWSLLLDKIAADPLSLQERIEKEHLNYREEDMFIPILIDVFYRDDIYNHWGGSLFEFTLKNAVSEIFASPIFTVESVIRLQEKVWAAILKCSGPQNDPLEVRPLCENYIQKMNRYLKMDVRCNIGDACDINGVNPNIKSLQAMSADNVNSKNCTFLLCEYRHREIPYNSPSMNVWESLLANGDREALEQNAELYLDNLAAHNKINADTLKLFRLDVTQLVYSELKRKEILAHKLFANRGNHDELYERSIRSVENMKVYVRHLFKYALQYTAFAESSRSVIDKLLDYLNQNFNQEVSRNNLAEIVFLNPDYISRLFKREVGMSIGSYLLNKRLETAKELLRNGSLPINAISMHVGYSNFSYFTKTFREATGVTPNEYRKQFRTSS